jgi:hypothetical protein
MKTQISLGILAAVAISLQATAQVVSVHVSTAQELQNALTSAAANGADDVIYLGGGRYIGNFNFNSAEAKSLALQAEDNVAAESIIIDGAGTGRSMSLSCSANAAITVHGITFLRNCGGYQNAGLRIATGSGGDVLIEDCSFLSPADTAGLGLELATGHDATIRGCTAVGAANGAGQGVSIPGFTGKVIFQSCVVASNTIAVHGSGLGIPGGNVIEVRDSTFTGNDAPGYSSGGGVYCLGGTVTLSNNVFTANGGYGGGGAYAQSSVSVTVTDNTFANTPRGAGAYVSSPIVLVSGNTFTGNKDSGLGCGGQTVTVSNNTFSANSGTVGGGCQADGAVVNVSRNTFTGNSAVHPSSGVGGAVYLSNPQGQITLSGNTFTRNTATAAGGGAWCGGRATVLGNSFQYNTASQGGGGLYVDGSQVTLLNNLIARNQQSGANYGGGGLWVRASSTLDMLNNTICANTNAGTGGVGGGVAFTVAGVTEILQVHNNIIWDNKAAGNGVDVYLAGTGSRKVFQYNDTHDMYGVWDLATLNLDVDPQLFDPVNGDYHVRGGSPCVNAGTNSTLQVSPTDLDGAARVAADVIDIGCYEFDNLVKHPADVNGDWVVDPIEYDNYSTFWKTDQPWTISPTIIPADYVTRAGFLHTQNSGRYQNDGSARPLCWKTRP